MTSVYLAGSLPNRITCELNPMWSPLCNLVQNVNESTFHENYDAYGKNSFFASKEK